MSQAIAPLNYNSDLDISRRIELAKAQGLALNGGKVTSANNSPDAVKEQFMAIFYKELLKKAIKMPTFSSASQKDSMSATFASDILINKMALELAQSKSFSADNYFPAASEIQKGIK